MSDRQQDNEFAQVERPQTSVHETAAPTTPAEAVEVVPLAEVLRHVRRDSRREPQQYLDETIVPFGGE